MSSTPKASDKQILHSVKQLRALRKAESYCRFGQEDALIAGARRVDIQQQLEKDHGITYSEGGFRSRLKRMVKEGTLEKFRLFERTVFYSIPE